MGRDLARPTSGVTILANLEGDPTANGPSKADRDRRLELQLSRQGPGDGRGTMAPRRSGVSRSGGALQGISISIRPVVPKMFTR